MNSALRRVLACILLAVFLLPGLAGAQELRGYDAKAGYQYIALGTWPQGENGEIAPILWRVLAADGEEALLLSEYVLGNGWIHRPYEEYPAFGGAWNRTNMFQFLNGEFLEQAFSGEEKLPLLSSEELGTVFLLTADDLKNKAYGFSGDTSRMGYGTPYALANGLFKYSNKSSPYWTRSRSTTLSSGVRCTKVKGALGYIRCEVENEGWRPALRLSMVSAEIASGEGTKELPFVIAYAQKP